MQLNLTVSKNLKRCELMCRIATNYIYIRFNRCHNVFWQLSRKVNHLFVALALVFVFGLFFEARSWVTVNVSLRSIVRIKDTITPFLSVPLAWRVKGIFMMLAKIYLHGLECKTGHLWNFDSDLKFILTWLHTSMSLSNQWLLWKRNSYFY